MVNIAQVRKGAYHDSVKLMQVGQALQDSPGVQEVAVGMGTELNRSNLVDRGMNTPETDSAGQTDLMIAVRADDDSAAEAVLGQVDDLLASRADSSGDESGYQPKSVTSALKAQSGSNVLIVSIPGAHVRPVVSEAIRNGVHVMLFSDNVSLEDERELKELAVAKDVLVMGPDCGTAMINGVPLCFANRVRRGPIGLVSASGTGSQEVMTQIHQMGSGISQALGTGGRDLKEEIGGLTFMQALAALNDDVDTEVIVLVSKPPAPRVAEKVMAYLRDNVTKPVIVDFLGAEAPTDTPGNVTFTHSLEECAARAVEAANGNSVAPLWSSEELKAHAERLADRVRPKGLVKGLFSGGTLASEAQLILQGCLGEVTSNLGGGPAVDEKNPTTHFIIDFGDDAYTTGRAHPMIDPSLRAQSFRKHLADERTGLILMDIVLGYGSNEAPHKEIVKALRDQSNAPPVIINVCGVEEDPQGMERIVHELTGAGATVAPSNKAATDLACMVMNQNGEKL